MERVGGATHTVTLTKVRAQFTERGARDLALIPHIVTAQTEPAWPKSPFAIWVLTFVRMTVCGGWAGNLSPPAHLPLPSSAVSGMGGMSSVTYARERAELVRAWWVTASGSGVAICGDTGKKLDRPVPAGFETVPQGIRVNLRVRDASGITTKPSNRTRCPPCIPHPSHISRAQARGGFCADTPFLPILWGGGPAKRGRGAAARGVMSATGSTAYRRLRAGPFDPSFAKAMEGPLPHIVGKKESVALSPDSFRGLAAFQAQAPPGPGTRPGEVGKETGKEGSAAQV